MRQPGHHTWIKVFLLLLGLGLVVGVLWWYWAPGSSSRPSSVSRATVLVNTTSLSVVLADTPAKQTQGLSGLAEMIDEDGLPFEGMYFPLDPDLPTSFWMKDMKMSIDIIWLYQGTVIKIDRSVPIPAVGMTDGELPRYQAGSPADAVLELMAGRSQELGIEVGSRVSLLSNVRMMN